MKKLVFILMFFGCFSCGITKQVKIERHIRERLKTSFESTPRRNSPPTHSTYYSRRRNPNSLSKPRH